MNKQENKNKKLAEELKTKLNSPDYVAIPEILGHNDRYGDMLAFCFGRGVGESVHSEKRNNFIADMSCEKKKME